MLMVLLTLPLFMVLISILNTLENEIFDILVILPLFFFLVYSIVSKFSISTNDPKILTFLLKSPNLIV